MSNKNTHIIAFVGMPGAGKSSAVDYLTGNSMPKVYFGGVIIDAVKEAGLAVTAENEQMVREKLRREEGKDAVAKRIISQINGLIDAGQKKIVADGLYTWPEYRALKSAFPGELTVVAIVASRNLRHRRLAKRTIRPLTAHEATERDWAEIENMDKGGPIAIADHYIINEGSLDELHTRLDDLIQETHFCKAPMQC